jgi:hypothetical protein
MATKNTRSHEKEEKNGRPVDGRPFFSFACLFVFFVNEVPCKFVAHNICCVLMAQHELGIEPVFWQNEEAGPPTILPMVRPG